MKNCFGRLVRMAWLAALPLMAWSGKAETDPYWYAVQVSATVQTAPPQIQLSWPTDANATGYTVYRKAFNSITWSSVGTLPASATTFSDVNVTLGGSYEYGIKKSSSLGFTGTGYVYAGINAPMIESRGKLILMVDNTYVTKLVNELGTLEQDLIGDGWTVIRHDVSSAASVSGVKSLIKADYAADPTNVKAVFLFGHVPVPYSGDLNPDGHPDHKGAWPADVYYADMDGVWTDSTVNDTSAARTQNQNVPGDLKFDQSTLPSDVELELGRVDMSNLTCFSNKTPARGELDLLKQYLSKDHNFRHGKLAVQRRGIVCDNFGERSGEAFAASGWRNFAAFFGASKVTATPGWTFFSTLATQDYLWAYGTGGGSYTTCDGVGGSDNFATTDLHAVFTMFLGSYFGDWDNESAFLRAPLGSTSYTLTASWAGRPHWFYHHMGLGQTIGYSTRLTQNNPGAGLYENQVNYAARGVHVALMGDPSLRMHPVIPPSNGGATIGGTGVGLTWAASTDTAIQGYHVYRAGSFKGPFTRVSGNSPLVTLAFNDPTGTNGGVYMVRAVKLEQSGSGTYYNPSQGIFITAGSMAAPVPNAPTGLSVTAVSGPQMNLSWTLNSTTETGVKVFRKTGVNGTYALIKTLPAGTKTYSNSGMSASTQYYYKVAAYNSTGDSPYSNESFATTPPPPAATIASATFLLQDKSTSGNWKGVYGPDGYYVLGDSTKVPSYVQAGFVGNSFWSWADSTSSVEALQKAATTDRVAACWYNAASFDINLNFTDGLSHRVALYFVDWDYAGRQQTVQILDTSSGAILNTQTISAFEDGQYLVLDLKGKVTLRIARVLGANAIVSGIFFGNSTLPTPTATVAAAQYIGMNSSALGNWKGLFGAQGCNVIDNGSVAPTFATVSPSNKTDYLWDGGTSDPRALQNISDSLRTAACWYAPSTFNVNVRCKDALTHKVTLYCLDWDRAGRTQTIDVIDTNSGVVLHSATINAFSNGVYLSWNIKGDVTFRFTRNAGSNVLVNGLFFDAGTASL
jgi:hypothetical protein